MLDKIKDFTQNLKKKAQLQKILSESTCNGIWNVSNSQLQVIADYTYSDKQGKLIMKQLWKNLGAKAKQWRRIQNTLSTLEFLIKNGAPRVIHQIKMELYRIRSLSSFTYVEGGIDRAEGLRDKAESIARVLSDPSRLEKQREGSRKNRTKICGLGSNASDAKMGSLSSYSGGMGGISSSGGGGYGGTSGFGSSSSKKGGTNDWVSSQSTYYNGGSYDPYVKKTKKLETYETQKQMKIKKSELFKDTEEKKVQSRPKPKKKPQNVPGFVNRKAQMRGEGFDIDDDEDDYNNQKDQYSEQEETKPKKKMTKKVNRQEEVPQPDLLNMMEQAQAPAAPSGGNNSLFQNMQISGQQASQQNAPNLFQFNEPQQQQQQQQLQQQPQQQLQNLFTQQQQQFPQSQPIQQPPQQQQGSLFSQMNMSSNPPATTTTNPSPSLFQNMQLQQNPTTQPSNPTSFSNPTNTGMFPFINQTAPTAQPTTTQQQHPNTINNSTSLVINMTLGQNNSQPPSQNQVPFGQFSIQSNQNIQNPSSNFSQPQQPQQQQQQQIQFGDFNQASIEETPSSSETQKKDDAWNFGSELFNLQNLNDQKDKNKAKDSSFSNIFQNTQQIGNNLLHTKGQDLNMIWNQPMMGMPNVSGPTPSIPHQQNQFGGGFQNVMGGMMNQAHMQQQQQPQMNPGFGGQQGSAFSFMQNNSNNPQGFGFNPMQQQQQQQQQSQFNFMNQMSGPGQMRPQQQQQPQSGFSFMQQQPGGQRLM